MFFFALKTVLFLISLFTSQVNADACESTTPPSNLDTSTLVTFTDFRVTCSPATVTVKLDHCAVQCLGHDSTEELTITDPTIDQVNASQVLIECRPELVGNDTVFVINISDCSPSITNNMSHAIYTYAVRSYADEYISGSVTRGTDIAFIFSCLYNLNVRTSLALGGAQSSSSLSYAPVSYDLAVAMAIFNSSTFSYPVTGTLEVVVPDHIHVGLTFTDGDANYLVLQAVKCWATPTSSFTDARQYVILENGCPTDPSDYTTVKVYENYESSQAKFSFAAFTWGYLDPSQQSIYVHCEVEVCDSVLNDTCIVKGCMNMGRKKRKRSTLSSDSIVVSVGSLNIATPSSVCEESNGGCDHVCEPGNHGDVTCSCVPGYQLLDDRKTCVVSFPGGNSMSSKLEKIISSADLLVLIAISLILLISAVLIVAIVRKTITYKSRDEHKFQEPL